MEDGREGDERSASLWLRPHHCGRWQLPVSRWPGNIRKLLLSTWPSMSVHPLPKGTAENRPVAPTLVEEPPQHSGFSDKLFMPFLALFYIIVVVLFAIGVRYGDFNGESALAASGQVTQGRPRRNCRAFPVL